MSSGSESCDNDNKKKNHNNNGVEEMRALCIFKCFEKMGTIFLFLRPENFFFPFMSAHTQETTLVCLY